MMAPRVCRLGVVVAVLAAATFVFAPPVDACACGALIPPSGEQADLNQEVALVHWDGATETVVMQLALDATTANVALVVPTPTPATVKAGDKATFTELDALSKPKVEQRRHWTLGSLFARSAPHAAAPTKSAPEVVSQVHLGPLEATTLAGGDLGGLRKWLADNGYSIQPAVSDALGPYVHDGWAFVAMRLTSTAPIVGGLDPVRLTFRSSQLVYPMRLSVAAPGLQRVTIFALADHRQQRVDADASAQSSEVQYAGRVSGAVQDPLLRELVGGHGSYLTKVQVVIPDPSRISSDFAFGNAPNDDPYRQVVVIDHDVFIPVELVLLAGFLFVGIVAAVVILVVLRRRRKGAAGSVH